MKSNDPTCRDGEEKISPKVNVSEVKAKSIINVSKISDVRYAINPYVGCQHGCVYCYARFMSRYSGHLGEEWGCFVDVKINALEILEDQLSRKRESSRDQVLLSSVTDAYQPIEKRYEITRGCLELLHRYQYPVSILTKSDLVTRDIDILSENKENEVGVTIISMDESVRRIFEPATPSAVRRLNALEKCSENGIKTFAFLGPIIPHLSWKTIPDIISRLAEIEIDHVYIDRLNIKAGNGPIVKRCLERFPEEDKIPALKGLQYSDTYYSDLRLKLEELLSDTGLNARMIF